MKMQKKGASHLTPGDVVLGWYVPTAPTNVVQEMAAGLTVAEVHEQKDLNERIVGHYVGWQLGDTVVWSDLHPITDRALYVPAATLPEPETAGEFACAECGTTTATTYVVTTLNPADPKGTRTEVCSTCHDVVSQPKGMPPLVFDGEATGAWMDTLNQMEGWNVTIHVTDGTGDREGAIAGTGRNANSGTPHLAITGPDGETNAYSDDHIAWVTIH